MTASPGSPASGPLEPAKTTGAELHEARAEAAELRKQLADRRMQADEDARRFKLADEQLQHRARNTIALVRSAFRRTAETGQSLEDVEMHFCGRLDVLARYMLPHSGKADAKVDVENLIRDELRNFEFGEAPGISIKGPSAELSLDQAQPFALMIHELVTNALKFGALTGLKDAALEVTWSLDDNHLTLVWAETGVPMVMSAPVHRGFGREYIEEALPYQVGATTRFELRPGGVVCAIELPLATADPFVNGEET